MFFCLSQLYTDSVRFLSPGLPFYTAANTEHTLSLYYSLHTLLSVLQLYRPSSPCHFLHQWLYLTHPDISASPHSTYARALPLSLSRFRSGNDTAAKWECQSHAVIAALLPKRTAFYGAMTEFLLQSDGNLPPNDGGWTRQHPFERSSLRVISRSFFLLLHVGFGWHFYFRCGETLQYCFIISQQNAGTAS